MPIHSFVMGSWQSLWQDCRDDMSKVSSVVLKNEVAMKPWGVVAMAILAIAGAVGCESAPAVSRFYVATNGSDAWTGRLAAPNKARTDGPLATLEGARDTVRRLKSEQGGLKHPVVVSIRGGTYYLPRTLELTAEDTGTRDCPITYEAYHGEKALENVIISGGRRITGFAPAKANGHDVVAADVPEAKSGWYPDQLFVNGLRADRTRLPKQGYYIIKSAPLGDNWQHGQDSFTFDNGEISPDWHNLSDVDVVAFTLWVEFRMPIKSVDASSNTVQLAKRSRFWLANDQDKSKGARYVLENVYEALDTPGQWYLDRTEGKLYYYPKTNEDWPKATFVAPMLENLVRLDGTKEHPVEFVRFRNLAFAHTQHKFAPDWSGSAQAAVDVPGAMTARYARHCNIERCEVSHIGNYAVEFGEGCSHCSVRGSLIDDMGAGGIKIGHGSEYSTISDNRITDGGKIFASAVGVLVLGSPHNKVTNNEISELNYTGVSVGWTWGYGHSNAIDNLIACNHIHHIGRGVLSDLGGIYTLGVSPGTIERNNLIHDCESYSYGGWGIYTDEGSSNILIEDNIVYNTKSGGFHQHYGQHNTVTNNIFAFSREDQLRRSRPEEGSSFTFERNIVYYDTGALLDGSWKNDHYSMDHNLYYDASGRPVTFQGASFDDWTKRHDQHSIIADPMFVNAKKHDFRLQPGSPAPALGFRQIDMSRVGPRGTVGVGSKK